MLEKIITKGFWAESLTENEVTRTATIYVGDETRRPRVTAEISLSRLKGSGTAKAIIWSYEYQHRWDSEHITQPVEPPLSLTDPLRLVKGSSQYTFDDAVSVTFGITVTNMFAYANCSVFIYETTSLRDLLLTPVHLVDQIIGP